MITTSISSSKLLHQGSPVIKLKSSLRKLCDRYREFGTFGAIDRPSFLCQLLNWYVLLLRSICSTKVEEQLLVVYECDDMYIRRQLASTIKIEINVLV